MTSGTRFPDGFRWGTATPAHQVEGGNWNNDWWAWEHAPDTPCEAPSGDACDQWNLYDGDIALCAALGFDNYRFSIEWSRIEPEEGEFSAAALEHYAKVGAALWSPFLARAFRSDVGHPSSPSFPLFSCCSSSSCCPQVVI